MPGSIFPFGKDSKAKKKRENVMTRKNIMKGASYFSAWVGKRRLKIQVSLLIAPCFFSLTISLRIKSKREKKPDHQYEFEK